MRTGFSNIWAAMQWWSVPCFTVTNWPEAKVLSSRWGLFKQKIKILEGNKWPTKVQRPPLSPADRMASVVGKIINIVPHWTTKLYTRKFECFCCLNICTYHLHMGYPFLSNLPSLHNSIEDPPQLEVCLWCITQASWIPAPIGFI